MFGIISLGIDNIWDKNTIFDNAKVLKIIIFPLRVILSNVVVSSITFLNFFFQVQFFYHIQQNFPNIFTAFLVILFHR